MSLGSQLYDAGVRIFLVLDFDGVVNAFPTSRGPSGSGAFSPWQVFTQMVPVDDWTGTRWKLPITWSPGMIAALNRLLDDPRVQLCWLTSWQDQVWKPARRMGLASRAARQPVVISYNKRSNDDQIGKMRGLEIFLADLPTPAGLVWVDDQLHCPWSPYTNLVTDCCDNLGAVEQLLLGPNENRGISVTEMAAIEDFVQQQLSLN